MPRSDRLCASLLLAGGIGLLVSMYLPWFGTACGVHWSQIGLGSPVPTFGSCQTTDGWSPTAVLAGLLLCGLSLAVLVRPALADRLPLGLSALLAIYFGLVAAAEARVRLARFGSGAIHLERGAGLAIAAGILIVVGAADARLREITLRGRGRAEIGAAALAVVVLATLFRPWESLTYGGSGAVVSRGFDAPAGAVIAALAVWALVAWWDRRPERLALSAALPLFVAGALATPAFDRHYKAAGFVALGASVALAVLAIAGVRPLPRPEIGLREIVVLAGAALVVAGLFVPWVRECAGGTCISSGALGSTWGVAAAAVATACALLVLDPGRLRATALELGAALAVVLVTLSMLDFAGHPTRDSQVGAFITFAGAALLVVPPLLRLRVPRVERSAIAALGALTALVALLAVLLLPLWQVLPDRVLWRVFFAGQSWIVVVCILLAIRLARLWIDRTAGAGNALRLTLIPLGLLAVVAAQFAYNRHHGVGWGGGAAIGLCLVLALLGHAERQDGLRHMRMPDVLRVDRV